MSQISEYISDNEKNSRQTMNSILSVGLPELPLGEEVMWGLSTSFSLPPINRMLKNHIVVSRLEAKGSNNSNSQTTADLPKTYIAPEFLEQMGLPNLPFAPLKKQANTDHARLDSGALKIEPNNLRQGSANDLNYVGQSFATAQYALDDAALGRVLAATSLLIERMSTQRAVDCLMDMPVWMRNIFLARHGVSRVVGLMLAARLDAAGETSIIGPDGEVIVHNKPGPVVEVLLNCHLPTSQLINGSSLDQLVMARKTRNIGVKIKNKNALIQQRPVQMGKYLQRLGPL